MRSQSVPSVYRLKATCFLRLLQWSACLSFFLTLGLAEAQTTQTTQVRDRKARVARDFVEVRSGPAEAYSSRGRLYRNDQITVRGKAGENIWVEVVGGGLKGWVRLAYLSISDLKANTRAKDGRFSPGLDRRLKSYSYDKAGRRIGIDGKRVGSGEGTQDPANPLNRQAKIDNPAPAVSSLTVRALIGMSQVKRAFGSNIDRQSFLRQAFLKPFGLFSQIEVDWTPLQYLSVGLMLSDARLGTASVLHPTLNDGRPIDLSVEMQDMELAIWGRYPIGILWFGVKGAVRMFRRDTQEIKPIPIQVNLLELGGDVGAGVGLRWWRLRGEFNAGVYLPFMADQSPVEGGEITGDGIWLRGSLEWWFNDKWSVIFRVHHLAMTNDFKGPSKLRDTLTVPGEELTFDVAQQKDSLLGIGLGVGWALD